MKETNKEILNVILKVGSLLVLFIGGLLVFFLPLAKGSGYYYYEEVYFNGRYYKLILSTENVEIGFLSAEDGFSEAIQPFLILAFILFLLGALAFYPWERDERINEMLQRIMIRTFSINLFLSGVFGTIAFMLFFNFKERDFPFGKLTFFSIFGLVTFMLILIVGTVKSFRKARFKHEIELKRNAGARLTRIAEIIVHNYQMEEFEKRFLEKFKGEIQQEEVHKLFREVLKIYLRTDLRTNEAKDIAKPFIYLADEKELEIMQNSIQNIFNPLRKEMAQKIIKLVLEGKENRQADPL